MILPILWVFLLQLLLIVYRQGIVKYRKVGKLAFYSLDNKHIKQLIVIALALKKECNVNACKQVKLTKEEMKAYHVQGFTYNNYAVTFENDF
ncbi:helix-turn-helix domain-containing protein [Lysinibacillus sp. 3P01SB]